MIYPVKWLPVFLVVGFFSVILQAQNLKLSGVVLDADTQEPLIGASIMVDSKGTVTDFDGEFELELLSGSHTVAISYVGYTRQDLSIDLQKNLFLDIRLSTMVLQEVVVVADIAKERETPVAFSNVPSLRIREELGSRDLVMMLNSTPGAYATQTGGGDGDARVTIRGFNQRNVAVMIDGIPVNDMENGWVYWSNWFGLDLMTQTMQVQRGLGASKISLPSVGGTINILTKGIDAKRDLTLRQEVGNDGFLRTVLGFSSGRMKNGWAFSLAGSHKVGDGWVDGTFTRGWFYYARVDKQLGKHLLSLQGFGAPQEHGQRTFKTSIQTNDIEKARDLGVPEEVIFSTGNYLGVDHGRKYNQHWGYYDGDLINTSTNYYHKPQFSFRHSWQPDARLFWSNIAYLSVGRGGGTSPEGDFQRLILPNGQMNLDSAATLNRTGTFLKPAGKSERILRSSVNDHFWYGLLSTLKYELSQSWSLSAGVDGRYYRGDHYRTVYDLLGGDYFIGSGNTRIDQITTPLYVGDKFDYDNSGFVRWAGAFGLAEWKNQQWTAFLNVSGARSSYKIEDYMKAKAVVLADTILYVSYGKSATHEGQTYTLESPEAKNQVVGWVNIPSFTFKTGASFLINRSNSVFFNTGYLSRAQRFNNVLNDRRNDFRSPIVKFANFENEKIKAFELGYSYSSRIFSANVNTYYTIWENKPLDSPVQQPIPGENETVPVNIPGIDALHKGIEVDFAFKPIAKLTLEGLASIGDWKWNSAEMATIYLEEFDTEVQFEFDAKGVHVGDAAQLQYGGVVRYEPIKGLYFRLKGMFFGKNYADFQPETLRGDNAGRDSWQMPDYFLLDAHAGYGFKWVGANWNFRVNVLNVLDTSYMSDATNNETRTPGILTRDFDAKSAAVHFAPGRTWNTSLQVSF